MKPQSKRLSQLFAFLEADPNDAFTRYSIAYEYAQHEAHQEAIVHFEKLVADHPTYIGTYYHYGASLLEIGQREAAEAIYEAGIAQARTARDTHALSELQTALNNMLYED